MSLEHVNDGAPMSPFWKNWLNIWCLVVVLFGIVLAVGGHAAGGDIARLVFAAIGRDEGLVLDPHTRFSIALMGAVTLGLGMAYFVIIKAALMLGDRARPIWQLATLAILVWYVVDGYLSAHTGFATNIISNTGLLLGWLIPMAATGALKRN